MSDKSDKEELSISYPVGVQTGEKDDPLALEKLRSIEIENKEMQVLLGGVLTEEGTLPGGLGRSRSADFASEKKKRDKAFNNTIHRYLFEEALRRVDEIIHYHQEQLERLAIKIEEGQIALDKLEITKKALEKEIHNFEKTGAFELDENGNLKDEESEAALRVWEAKTGTAIDRSDPSSYLIILKILRDTEIQIAELKDQQEIDQKNYEFHKTRRDEAQLLKDALQSDDPAIQEWALEGIKDLDKRQQVEQIQAIQAKPEKTKPEQKLLEQSTIKAQDLKQDGFAFNFPPLNADFKRAAPGETKVCEPLRPDQSIQPLPLQTLPKL